MIEVIFYSLVGGLFSLFGGILLALKYEKVKSITTPLLAFSAGSFLAVAFFDLLPESIESVGEPHDVFVAVVIGFLMFFILERAIMRFRNHSHDIHDSHIVTTEHAEPLPTLIIIGDSIHNFLDGIVIALAYLANPAIGIATTISIVAHEIPQEIGDFGILLSQGWKRGRVILVNVLQSLLSVVGAIIGYYIGTMLEPSLPFLLAGVSGMFLYIAGSDLIPEIHHKTGHRHFFRVVIPIIFGALSVFLLIKMTHG